MAQIREILISESTWEEMTCLFAPSLGRMVYSLSHNKLAEIVGFNSMLGSDEIFAKSPFGPKVVKGSLKGQAVSKGR
nr:hypothetical protein [Escherichia coli]